MRILVCGGRDFDDRRMLFRVLRAVHRELRIAEVIHGAARGADHMAGLWAKANDVPCSAYPVDHKKDGPWPRAGAQRNMRMYTASRPDMVLAFPGGRGECRSLWPAKPLTSNGLL